MISSNQSHLLKVLSSQFPVVQSSALVTVTGLMLESTFSSDIKKANLAAISSRLLHRGEAVVKSADSAELTFVDVLCAKGNIVITRLFEGVVLVMLVDPKYRMELDIHYVINFLLGFKF